MVGVGTKMHPQTCREGAAGPNCPATSNGFESAMVTTSTRIDNPETAALARRILLSIFLETDGFHLAACRLSNLPEATAPAMMYALRNRWLELRSVGVCLTPEGRRLAIKQAN
jgi:hypothetical protein